MVELFTSLRRHGHALLSTALILTTLSQSTSATETHTPIPKPQYHYGAKIPITCLNRSIETGEHISDAHHNLQYIPFWTCAETSAPLTLSYGIDTALNCTISPITDPLFHLLEFYIHADAPLTCRVPARPPQTISVNPIDQATKKELEAEEEQEWVPLVFALAGTLQLSHLHVATHMNVLLHSVPKHHLHKHDSGVIDSGVAYSTSPIDTNLDGSSTGSAKHNVKLVIGDDLPLRFEVRWFPSAALPALNGRYEWNGMGGHVYASTVFYCLAGFGAGCIACAGYFWGVILPKRLRGVGKGLGGATPLGFGMTTGKGVGNGWGMNGKRMD